ncbi:MAG: HEAT repeat domain-containing protein [Acidobacteria bacterium]|nr:HEAT repeat domain-containing protein [Acidobacteriota bacterium]
MTHRSMVGGLAGAAFAALGASACASAPPAPATTASPGPNLFEKKIAAILRLEDQRVLRDPAPPPTPAPPPLATRGQRAPVIVAPEPAPDLIEMLSDDEARIRRRAALAVGRVRLVEGVAALVPLMKDEEPEVRQMAAFAMGLIGAISARDPLVDALNDPAPMVQGSAAEALGLIGAADAADAIGRLAAQIVRAGVVTPPPADEDDARRDTPASTLRLCLYALVRLKAYPQIASAVLDERGQPRVRWWPVAYALQRTEDPRALPALLTLARESHPYTRAFAVKGLATLKDRAALPVLMPLLSSGERFVLVETIRALGRIGDRSATGPLLRIIRDTRGDAQIRLEAASAIGGIHDPEAFDVLTDVLFEPSPQLRAAALRSLASIDQRTFILLLSSLDPDKDWTVRAALATILGGLPAEIGLPRLMTMINDADQRVIPSVLASLVTLQAPAAPAILIDRLNADDPVVRAAAATGLGTLKPANGAEALADAYRAGQRDSGYGARAAALAALAKYGAAAAMPVLRAAFADTDWAVRVRAAMLATQLDPDGSADAQHQIRPAPPTLTAEAYRLPRLTNPPVSTQVFIDTDRGTIQIELAVLDAPLTAENFAALARKGYFNGLAVHRVVPDFVVQDGDPRGDGEGEPGYTIRDEFNERPYLRGTIGMALDPWPDTGGSQWFIAHSPQPHLDAKYTVFGRVIAGMDVVDQIQQGDVIRSVRVWDGVQMSGGSR